MSSQAREFVKSKTFEIVRYATVKDARGTIWIEAANTKQKSMSGQTRKFQRCCKQSVNNKQGRRISALALSTQIQRQIDVQMYEMRL